MPFGPANPMEIDSDPLMQVNIQDAVRTMEHPAFGVCHGVLKYVLSDRWNKLFYIVGNAGRIDVGEVLDDNKICQTASAVLALYESYVNIFIKTNNDLEIARRSQAAREVFDCWFKVYRLLILPIRGIRGLNSYKEVFCQCNISVDGQSILFNLPLLYDMSYRFGGINVNEALYFTYVSDGAIAPFFNMLMELSFPKACRVCLLNALEYLTATPGFPESLPREEAKRICIREAALRELEGVIKDAGGNSITFTDIDDLKTAVSTSDGRNVIHLFAHFHDGRLLAGENIIRMKLLERLFRRLNESGTLKKDLIIDAVTCTNYGALNDLKKWGVSYIYYSHRRLDTDWAVQVLSELHTGRVARQLNWKYPYLDGATHLHIAYADVTRAFFAAMNEYSKIKIPDIWNKVC